MHYLARARRRTYEVLEVAGTGDGLSRFFDLVIMGLVACNVAAVVLASVASIEAAYHDLFIAFEQISIAIFSAEFLLRFWASAEGASQHGSTIRSRLRYLCSPLAIVDLLAIAPFYLSTFFAMDLRILRLLRVVKLTRYSTVMGRMSEVLRLQAGALATAFFLLILVMIFAASTIYVVEHEAQPQAFGSIPAAMWWAVCTLTTVGYGDVTPITPLGKLLASGITILGIGMVALPTSLLASGFSEIMARNRRALEAEAEQALADGEITREESDSYSALAEALQVEPEIAGEIIALAQRRNSLESDSSCPHCGKAIS